MRFEIVSDVGNRTDLGLFGTLYIETDSHPFPPQCWSGNISEALILWAESLCSLLESASNSIEELFFPSSAYSFSIRRSGANLALISLRQDTMPFNGSPIEVSFFSVVGAVYSVIAGLISDIQNNGIAHIKRLKSIAARLKKSSESFGFHFE